MPVLGAFEINGHFAEALRLGEMRAAKNDGSHWILGGPRIPAYKIMLNATRFTTCTQLQIRLQCFDRSASVIFSDAGKDFAELAVLWDSRS